MSYALSPSRINQFADCARCFWLEVNKGLSQPSAPFPSLPLGFDKRLRDYFDRYRDTTTEPPELAAIEGDLRLVTDRRLLRAARAWDQEPIYEAERVNVRLRGAVDELLRTDSDHLVIMDYKTRGFPPQQPISAYYRRQLQLYALLMTATGEPVADFGVLLYFHPTRVHAGGKVRFETTGHRVPLSREAATGWLERAAETLDGPIPEPNTDCDYCRWWNRVRMATRKPRT